MKKFIKTIVSLTAVSAMLLSTTAFAAKTQTVTKYSADSTTVTSTVSGLTPGSMVTYLAHTGSSVSETGDNIVYIGQETVGSGKSAEFEYTVDGDLPVGTYATIKYGSNVDEIEDTNTVEVGSVTVVWSGVEGTVTGDTKVGNGDVTTLNIAAAANSEIVAINVAGTYVDPENASAVTAKAGDTVTVTTAATNAAPAVYQLVGAKVALDENYTYEKDGQKVYTNSGIVRVIGSVNELYFTFNDGSYTMGGEVADGKFIVDGVSGNGYYGVEIEDTVDVSGFSVEAHAVVGSEEITVVEIQ